MACKVINEQEIVRMYLEDEKITVIKLATDNGVSKDRIRRILQKNNVTIRHQRTLTNAERTEICEKYFSGQRGSYLLAKDYNVNYSTIRETLMADSRYGTISRYKIQLEQEEKESIIMQYFDQDITQTELAKRYGRTRKWVANIINSTEMQNPKYSAKKKSMSERKKTPKRFLSVSADVLIEELKIPGMTQLKLAEKYKVSESCINHAIARYKGRKI